MKRAIMYNYVASVLDIYKEKVLVLDKRTKTKNKNTLSVKKPIDSVLHSFLRKKKYLFILQLYFTAPRSHFFLNAHVSFSHTDARAHSHADQTRKQK